MQSLDACSGALNPALPFKFFPDTKTGKLRGRLTGQRPAKGKDFSFARSIYVDDKAALYETRQAAVDGISLIKRHLLRFGLKMHSGTADKRSKTEAMHFPAKQTTSTAEDVRDLILDDGSIIHFCTQFTYLGSLFTPNLDDSEDVQKRINKANSAFGSMRALVFANPYIPLPLKRALYTSLVVNLLLWGCENWALKEEPLRKLQTFHTKCCRAMIGVSMWEVSLLSVTNENVLRYVGIPPMENIIHYRRLIWMGKIARMPFKRFPRKFLAAWTNSPQEQTYSRPHGRRQKSTRDIWIP